MANILGEPVFDAFTEGVSNGGLRSKSDIQLLICYLLRSFKGSAPVHILSDALQSEELANYFDVMDAISELAEHGNLTPELIDGEEYISLTEKGQNAIALVENDLPKSVRRIAKDSATHFLNLEKNLRENNIKIEPYKDGFHVSFTMNEQETDLLTLTVFVPDRDQAEKLKNNFLENPVKVYSAILNSLMEN